MTTEHTVEIVRFLLKHGATTYIKPKVRSPDSGHFRYCIRIEIEGV
jgi:hypothetical protein